MHLRSFGSLWWDQELEKLGLDISLVTWELFVERFKERFMSEYWHQARAEEFFQIMQSGSMVEAYEHRFFELKKFFRWAENDKAMIQHFIRGLMPKIGEEVRTFRPLTMQEASKWAKLIEMKSGYHGVAYKTSMNPPTPDVNKNLKPPQRSAKTGFSGGRFKKKKFDKNSKGSE